jgi:hypothetical protein
MSLAPDCDSPLRPMTQGRKTDLQVPLKVIAIAMMFAVMGVGIAWVFEHLSSETQTASQGLNDSPVRVITQAKPGISSDSRRQFSGAAFRSSVFAGIDHSGFGPARTWKT